jgi:branched-chain amino acid transport system substrate-binding protein
MSKVLEAKKVYSLNDKSEYGVGLAEQIVAQLKKNGTDVVDDGLAPGGTYDGVASKVVKSNADVLYYSGYDADLARLVKALKAAGFKGKIMSDDGGKSDEYVSQTGSDAEGTLFSCACADALTDPNAKSFVDAFKAMHNTDPSTYSVEAYDATNTIIAAMKSLGKAEMTREEVVGALKTVSLQGLTGLIKFQENGDAEVQAIFIYEVKDNKIVVLGKTADLIK